MDNVLKGECEKEHKRVDERLDHHENWLGEHEQKLDRLDRSDASHTTAIENLCKQIGGQTKAIWGLVSIAATALVGFFIFVVEKGVVK